MLLLVCWIESVLVSELHLESGFLDWESPQSLHGIHRFKVIDASSEATSKLELRRPPRPLIVSGYPPATRLYPYL